MQFGSDEHLACIEPLSGPAQAAIGAFPGVDACLGFKFTVSWAGVPYRVTDDGYVVTTPGGHRYLRLDATTLQALQANSLVPAPLPSYAIPTAWHAAGYSAWAIAAVFAMALVWAGVVRRRVVRARLVTDVTTTGPDLTRAADRALDATLRAHLAADEPITHQAIAYDRSADRRRSGDPRHVVALTPSRLVLVTSNIGVFGIGKGEPKVTAIDRADVDTVDGDGGTTLVVRCLDGRKFALVTPLRESGISRVNQRAFVLDLPRLVGRAALPAARVVPPS